MPLGKNIIFKNSKKILCTVEARMGSSRLPKKVLQPLADKPMLAHIIERVSQAQSIENIVVATSRKQENNALEIFSNRMGVDCFRGSESDVLKRITTVVKNYGAEIIVCLTGDNPFIDACLIDDMVTYYIDNDLDYLTTTHMAYAPRWSMERTFPRGVTVQVVSAQALIETNGEKVSKEIRSHSTMAIYCQKDDRYQIGAFNAEGKYKSWRHPELRMTVDFPEDFEVADKIFCALLPDNPHFSTGQAIKFLSGRKDLQALNAKYL